MFGTAARLTPMVRPVTGRVFALIFRKNFSAPKLKTQATSRQPRKLPWACSSFRVRISEAKKPRGQLLKQSCLRKAFIFMAGVRYRLTFLSLAKKPRPRAPLLSKSCSATPKDAKAISLNVSFTSFAAALRSAPLRPLFQASMPALFRFRQLFIRACSSPKILIISSQI